MIRYFIILIFMNSVYAKSVLEKNNWLKTDKFEELQELFSDEYSDEEYLEVFEEVYKKENLNSEEIFKLVSLRLQTDKNLKGQEVIERFDELPGNWKKLIWARDILLIQKLRDELEKSKNFALSYPLMHPKKPFLYKELVDEVSLTLDHKKIEFEKNTLKSLVNVETELDDWQEVVLDILLYSLKDQSLWSYSEVKDLKKLKVKNLLQISHKNIGFSDLKHPLEKLMWVFSKKEYNSWYADDLKNLILTSLLKIKLLMQFYSLDDDLYELGSYLKSFLKDKEFDETWYLGQILLAEIYSMRDRDFSTSDGAKAVSKCISKENKYKSLCEIFSMTEHLEIESLYYSNKSELYLRLKKTSLKNLKAKIYLSSFDLFQDNKADLEFEVLLEKESMMIPKEFHDKKFHLILLSDEKIVGSFEIDANLQGNKIGHFPLRATKDHKYSFYITEKVTEDLSFFHPISGEFRTYSIKEKGLYQLKDLNTLGLWEIYYGPNLISSFNMEEKSPKINYTYKRKSLRFNQSISELDFFEFKKLNDLPHKTLYSSHDLFKSIEKINSKLLKTRRNKLNVSKLKLSYIVDINQQYFYFDQKEGLTKYPSLEKLINFDTKFKVNHQLYFSQNQDLIIPIEKKPIKEKKWSLKEGEREVISESKDLYGVFMSRDQLCPFEVSKTRRDLIVKRVIRPRSFIELKNPFQFNLADEKFRFDIFHDFVERLDNKIIVKDQKMTINPIQENLKLCVVNDYIK